MKRKIKLELGSLSRALDRFGRSWERAAKTGARGAEVRLTFESLPLLLGNLTPARWALLEDLKRHGPLSINELARRLKRAFRQRRPGARGTRR